jgi:hypothetical protein
MSHPMTSSSKKASFTAGVAALSLVVFSTLVGCKQEEEILLSCTGTETREATFLTPRREASVTEMHHFFKAIRSIEEYSGQAGAGFSIPPSTNKNVWIFKPEAGAEIFERKVQVTDLSENVRTRIILQNVAVNPNNIEVRSFSLTGRDQVTYDLNINRVNGAFQSIRTLRTSPDFLPLHIVAVGICTRLSGRRI